MIEAQYIDDIAAIWAKRAPDAVAFTFGDATLSYGALDAGADRLAQALWANGVQTGDRVGVFVDKSLDSALAIYGIMRAGAAYVPMDPGAPVERLVQIAQACGIKAMVSQERKQSVFEEVTARVPDLTTVLASDGTPIHAALKPPQPVDLRPRAPDDVAYIIFTSGSTGTPKGITHTHKSGLAYVRMSVALYGLTPDDRLSNHSPLHFDMSTFDMFSGPFAGATTVIISEMHMKLPASLAQLIEQEWMTIWYSVPHALIQLVERGALQNRDFSALRWVVFGGEPMLPGQLRAFGAHTPNARFSNSYGPAEVNQCSFKHLDLADLTEAPISIGTPCDHADLVILDDDTPADEGELYVATPAMMAGYWNDDTRNAAAFRSIGNAPARRYYRTGDLVRRDDGGELHFLGRSDRQVKVRGFRIELDEIELVMARHPDVSEAAAVVSGNPPRIAVYITAPPDIDADSADLRAFAAQNLPPQAVPTILRVLPEFKRTATGKIDRKHLAEASDV
ncbi:MAG: amino acid adenylation domain-containing protein [Pseudomonadota bacterium]